jgi:hypothetical protein
MRKIHPGFIALAILLGPATLILAHGRLVQSPGQEVLLSFDPPPNLRLAYTRCAETLKDQRSTQCDDYVSFFEQCATRQQGCDLREVYEMLSKVILSVPLSKPKLERVAATEQ